MIYSVTVKPGSKKGPLVVEAPTVASGDFLDGTRTCANSAAAKNLTVYLREKPVDGAANAALIKTLAEHFHVAKSCVVIKSGTSSRHKLIEIIN